MLNSRHDSHRDAVMRAFGPVLLSLALAAGGCAAALPGYTPPSKQRDRMLALQQTGGGFDAQGSYQLTDQEQKLDCKHLTGSITVKILQMRQSNDRHDPSTVAVAAHRASQPFRGGSDYGVNVAEDYKRDLARLETLNKQLAGKGCRTFDITKELAPGNKATPTPIAREGGPSKS
jgi:hypothetical protein